MQCARRQIPRRTSSEDQAKQPLQNGIARKRAGSSSARRKSDGSSVKPTNKTGAQPKMVKTLI
jgi:hypothetical protein